MLSISISERRALRAQAHHLDPVVMIGQHGLTTTVLREIARALDAHELVKVRVFNDDREARAAMLNEICETLACAPVQHIGKLLVLWRPAPEGETKAKPAKKTAKKAAKKVAPKTAARTKKHLVTPRGMPKGQPLSTTEARIWHERTAEKGASRKPRTAKTTRTTRRRMAD